MTLCVRGDHRPGSVLSVSVGPGSVTVQECSSDLIQFITVTQEVQDGCMQREKSKQEVQQVLRGVQERSGVHPLVVGGLQRLHGPPPEAGRPPSAVGGVLQRLICLQVQFVLLLRGRH